MFGIKFDSYIPPCNNNKIRLCLGQKPHPDSASGRHADPYKQFKPPGTGIPIHNFKISKTLKIKVRLFIEFSRSP